MLVCASGATDGTVSPDLRRTALNAGLWSSLPYDYIMKVSGETDVREVVGQFPAPVDHPAWRYLMLRTLRLNCLTSEYAPLWECLYEVEFDRDAWTSAFVRAPGALGVPERSWTMTTPLRTDFERRAALVEIDALSALMLGISAEQLALMWRGQFPVFRKYEYTMYFDARGRKIAKEHQAQGCSATKG